MNDKQLIFIGGLHRSGTTLLLEILRSHPAISGFANTNVPKDEGQLLQTVYPPGKTFGGPGNFGFDKASFMDEKHPLAKPESSTKLLRQWSPYWDLTKSCLLEKSPPNIVRTRFLQHIFPKSVFIIILRHPVAVAYATRKWNKNSIPYLIEHSLRCYERFREDMPFLNRVYVLRYEEFVLKPHQHIHAFLEWIGVEPYEFQFRNKVRSDVNDKYFALCNSDRHNLEEFEKRANVFGYSMDTFLKLLPINWTGPHSKALRRAYEKI